MKIKQEFILRQIAGDFILVPVADQSDSFSGIISLNEIGALIWRNISDGKTLDEIIENIITEYEVSKEVALKDTNTFINNLRNLGILDD